MIDDDDLTPRADQAKLAAVSMPRNLEPMSIEALHEYIAELEAEIARVRQDIEAKQGIHSAAEKFFKSKD